MTTQPSPEHYKARRWPLYLSLFASTLLIGYFTVGILFAPPSTDSVPPLQAAPTVSPVSPQTLEATPTASPSVISKAAIASGAVRQLYIPSTDSTKVIDTPVLAMPGSCQTVIEPPTSGPHVGDIFQCMDFAMPGTDTSTNVVVAGHSSYDLITVFNKLYPQGQSLIGRQVLIRTETSGSRWLDYQVQNVYEPSKDQLPYMAEIWQPTPGRLILVTCAQEGNGVSTHNFVVVAQFKGIHPA